MFSIMTMASSTTKPTETASAISERLSIEKPAPHIAAQVPASDSGTVTPAAIVGVGAAQEHEHHQHHQRDGAGERELHVVHAGADGAGAVGQDGDVDAGRDPALDLGDQRADAVDRLDDVGVGLLGDDQQHRRLPLNQAAERVLRVPCSTVATSDSRTTLPLAGLHDECRGSRRRVRSWSLVPMRIGLTWRRRSMPSGLSALAPAIAVRTSSSRCPSRRARRG